MGYVAVRGGGLAIEESLKLLEYERVAHGDTSTVEEIEITFPGLIEQVMGEASLYAPRLAALALKQAQGSPEEACLFAACFQVNLGASLCFARDRYGKNAGRASYFCCF